MQFLGLDISLSRRSDPILGRDDIWTEVARLARSGSSVTPDSAVQHAAVYACVKAIAETIATVPLPTYRRLSNGETQKADDLNIYHVLNTSPNDNLKMSRVDFFEQLVWHLLLRGNAYSQILTSSTDVLALLPLHADRVTVKVGKDGRKANKISYTYSPPGIGQEESLNASRVLHVKDSSYDGICGISRINQTRDVIGLALAKDNYESKLYAQGTRLSGVIEHPETLDDETSDRIAESFRKSYSGPNNMHKVAVLEEGMKFKQMAMTNSDAEFVQSRKMSVIDICRIFRVPPHIIGDLDKASFNNIEHLGIQYVTQTIRPVTVRIEQALNRDILPLAQKKSGDNLYAEFNLDGLLRGDLRARYQAYKIGLNNGFLSINDVRRKETMNIVEGGERYFVPANNLVPLDKIDAYVDAQIKSKNTQKDSSKDDSNEEGTDNNGADDRAIEYKEVPKLEMEIRQESRENKAKFDNFVNELRETYLTLVSDSVSRFFTKEVNDVSRIAKNEKNAEKLIDFYTEKHSANIINSLSQSVPIVVEQLSASAACFGQKVQRFDFKFYSERYSREYTKRRIEQCRDLGGVEFFTRYLTQCKEEFRLTEGMQILDDVFNSILIQEEK